jgi:hypothetical protein
MNTNEYVSRIKENLAKQMPKNVALPTFVKYEMDI